jgi:signal transduction histidine kinase
LGNAVQHTAAGGTVRVTAEADGEVVTFTVADTGRGLPPEAFARLFQRFGTADRAERGKASTGLGLAFSRAVVEAHGGRIWADSVLGQGTQFRFTLRSAETVSH